MCMYWYINQSFIAGDKNPETYDLSQLPESNRTMIEADSFWCLQKLLEGIQVIHCNMFDDWSYYHCPP